MPKIPTSLLISLYCYSHVCSFSIRGILKVTMTYLLHSIRRRYSRRPLTKQVKVGNLCWRDDKR